MSSNNVIDVSSRGGACPVCRERARLQPANGHMTDVVGPSNIRLRLARSKPLERFRTSLLLLPVGSLATATTHPLRSTSITSASTHYRAVRPSPAHRYFRPRGWSRLRLFPSHRRPGSHVPYQSQIELRAAYMPDAVGSLI
jgi:hypothetical protein